MSKTFHKRVRALLVSAVMTATSVAVTSAGGFFAEAAGGNVTINKTLQSSITNPDDADHPTNETDCTYMCAKATNEYTSFSDTAPKGIVDLYGEGITTLQFNLKADQMVTDFAYYFGCSADKTHSYWWDTNSMSPDGEALRCTPFASEFSIVIELPSYADMTNSGKFQFQNCYAALIDEVDQKTTTEKADVQLVSITVNGKTDTSVGTAPDWYNAGGDEDLPTGAENTGGLYYSSANSDVASEFKDNGDGTATVSTLNSLKIEDLDIDLTPGDNYSEEYYATDAGGNLKSETEIRNAGLPLNSHKFTYQDFGFIPGKTVAADAKVKSLSLTLKTEDNENVSRIMYGGGLNVAYKSVADTEHAKLQAGVKDDPLAGYWYNDVGAAALKQCTDAGVDWGNGIETLDVGGGSDLAKQELGSYFTVTWDVPAQVVDSVTTKLTDQISFQLWYAELVEGKFTDATIVEAALTYEESTTFPYTDTATLKSAGSEKVGTPVEMMYSDFNMNYEKTADVYAVQFDITTAADANQVLVGAGTSVLEKLDLTDNWFQADEALAPGKLILLNWEESTAGSRPAANDESIEVAPYKDAAGKKTYTFMWIMPPTVAEGIKKDANTGSQVAAINYVNAEEETANLSMGVWYAGLGETTSSTYTLNNVSLYYAADDTNNSAKTDKFEDVLSVVESVDVQIGETANITVNVPGCSILSSDPTKATAKLDADGNVVVSGKNVTGDTPVVLTITTPGGQVAKVNVNVLAVVTTETTETTTDTTSASTTTSTTTVTTATTGSSTATQTTPDYKANALYGDVNLDGKVDLADAILLNKAVADVVKLEGQAVENADCAYNGEVNSDDALTLLRFLVKLVNSIGPTA